MRQTTPRPTIKTLSEMTGFSIATISKALGNSPVVTEATRKAIIEAAEKVGYQASLRGRSLRTGKSYQIAVLMPLSVAKSHEWNGVEHAEILAGIAEGLEGSPYRIAVHLVRDTDDSLDVVRSIVEGHQADGVIFSGILSDDPRIAFLAAQGFPFVTLGRSHTAAPHAFVDLDSDWAAHAATQRLLEGGHRRIALVNPAAELAYNRDRINGYSRALAEAGLTFDPTLVICGDLTTRHGREAASALRSLPDPATGFVCVNESTALGVLSGLHALGVDVGQKASVIAYDDINASAYFWPPLTTFLYPLETLSRVLAKFMLRLLAGEDPASLTHFVQPEMIIRQPDRLIP
ncbi:MAG: substrate-binding domain-containing protein [Tabrizicola sp.]|nr:substrate-binding domain-containing protein [Tabrizicola sp.]